MEIRLDQGKLNVGSGRDALVSIWITDFPGLVDLNRALKKDPPKPKIPS